MIVVHHKHKKAYDSESRTLPFECTVTSPDGEVHECCLAREKHNGRLFAGYFDCHTRRFVVTLYKTIKEKWKVEFK